MQPVLTLSLLRVIMTSIFYVHFLANNTFGVWFWIHSMVMTNLEKLFFYLKDG